MVHHYHQVLRAPVPPSAAAAGPSPTVLGAPESTSAQPFSGDARENSPLTLLLWADEELRRRQVLKESLASLRAAPPSTAVAAPAPAPAVAMAVSQAVQLHGSMGMQTGPEAGAMGPLASKPVGAVLPGVTSARVGLLPGLRTADMLKYSGEEPKQKRKPPTDLSGLTDEQRVERRKQQARVYSKQARQRRKGVKAEMAKDVDALAFAREVFEMAPHVCMVLSGDVRRTTILYANHATEDFLHLDPRELLGQSFWDLIHADDRNRVYVPLGQLVLTRTGMATIRCRIRTSFAHYYLPMQMSLKFGSLGIVCSLWEAL